MENTMSFNHAVGKCHVCMHMSDRWTDSHIAITKSGFISSLSGCVKKKKKKQIIYDILRH